MKNIFILLLALIACTPEKAPDKPDKVISNNSALCTESGKTGSTLCDWPWYTDPPTFISHSKNWDTISYNDIDNTVKTAWILDNYPYCTGACFTLELAVSDFVVGNELEIPYSVLSDFFNSLGDPNNIYGDGKWIVGWNPAIVDTTFGKSNFQCPTCSSPNSAVYNEIYMTSYGTGNNGGTNKIKDLNFKTQFLEINGFKNAGWWALVRFEFFDDNGDEFNGNFVIKLIP